MNKIIKKPWGHEEIIHEEGNARLKRLVIKNGESLSLQYHRKKSEFLICVKGEAVIDLKQKSVKQILLPCGASCFIEQRMVHQIHAKADCEIIELACGDDEDIIRLKDKYGRIKTRKI